MHKIEMLLKRVQIMERADLRKLGVSYFGASATDVMSVKLLRLAISYKIQEVELKADRRFQALRDLAVEQPKMPSEMGFGNRQGLSPGTRLLREYRGKVHEVQAIDYGRFVYDGCVYKSLSAVARSITGTPRAGEVFFNLRNRAGRFGE